MTDRDAQSAPQQLSTERDHHPQYVRTERVRVRMRLATGTHCIGDIHVSWPDGRVSDVLNDERTFIPVTDVVMEGDSTTYAFLTLAKTAIAMVYEIKRERGAG